MNSFKSIHIGIILAVVVIGAGLVVIGIGSERQPMAITDESFDPMEEHTLAKQVDTPDISKPADDIPAPIARTKNELVVIELNTEEIVAEMADGVTYQYWTYNGTVPGPMIRVREGDDVEIRLSHGAGEDEHIGLNMKKLGSDAARTLFGIKTAEASPGHGSNEEDKGEHAAEGHATHSIDLHAVIGPGGGAPLTQVEHGDVKSFRFKATRPGLYVYHCASPHVPTHIANGMYGMILIEPAEGMNEVDKEFYVMQGDFYTEGEFGELGHQKFDKEKLLNEDPSYFLFNGRVGGLTEENALKAEVGDTIRMFVGVGSHVASNFHIVGAVLDNLYKDGAITDEPLQNVQTTIIPAGGAIMIEFTVDVPGKYLLVDHSLTRTFDKGALAELIVEGSENTELYSKVD